MCGESAAIGGVWERDRYGRVMSKRMCVGLDHIGQECQEEVRYAMRRICVCQYRMSRGERQVYMEVEVLITVFPHP